MKIKDKLLLVTENMKKISEPEKIIKLKEHHKSLKSGLDSTLRDSTSLNVR